MQTALNHHRATVCVLPEWHPYHWTIGTCLPDSRHYIYDIFIVAFSDPIHKCYVVAANISWSMCML